MHANWKQTTLGALCDETGGTLQTGPFGTQLHAHDYVLDGGVPVVPTSAIGRRRLVDEHVERTSREKADELARHYLKPGDILFARRGAQATGLSALVEARHSGWLCGTGAIRLRLNRHRVSPEYLSFVLSAEDTHRWLRQHAIGATMPNLNEGVIRGIPLTRVSPLRRLAVLSFPARLGGDGGIL
jgi:type I restriction enzyme, S subunit